MATLDYTQKKLVAFLEEINRIKDSEFPYAHSEEALQILEGYFLEQGRVLSSLGPYSPNELVAQRCSITLTSMARCLPLIGFILRSTNVRNAFEFYYPILRLAGDILEPSIDEISKRKVRLILSSEWIYSPHILSGFSEVLPGFVLIGQPAPESSNPFIIPLAGHELGHFLWNKQNCISEYSKVINKNVVSIIRDKKWDEYKKLFPNIATDKKGFESNVLAVHTWTTAAAWALKQAAETFCDFVGIRIFGRSYLMAFSYLLSPNFSGRRPPYYPKMLKRIGNMENAAHEYGVVNIPLNYRQQFQDAEEPKNLTESDEFQLSIADEAADMVVDSLIEKAKHFIEATGIGEPNNTSEEERIYKRYKQLVPAADCESVVNILNAAWKAFEDTTMWDGVKQISETNREQVLKDLILKNFEVFEIEKILKGNIHA